MPFLLLHPKLRHGVGQRCGRFSAEVEKRLASLPEKRAWFHGASMGDLLALNPTIAAFHAAHPEYGIVITTITDSGMALGERKLKEYGPVLYAPYDMAGPVRRFLSAIKPSLLVLEYTELWPVLMHKAKKSGAKLVLHNGRLSEGTAFYYRLLFAFTGNLLCMLDLLLMRSSEEAERALRGGAAPNHVLVTGNTKYDNLLTGLHTAEERHLFSKDEQTRLLVLGSIHYPEIAPLIKMSALLMAKNPHLTVGVAPRYMEHVEDILAEAAKARLKISLRSNSPHIEAGTLFVLDSVGELMDLYMCADLVFVGGSFCKRGGQNILEPAICGKAVLFGPSMANFKVEATLLHGRGGLQQGTIEQMEVTIDKLFNNSQELSKLGAMAKESVERNSGAAERNVTLITTLLEKKV